MILQENSSEKHFIVLEKSTETPSTLPARSVRNYVLLEKYGIRLMNFNFNFHRIQISIFHFKYIECESRTCRSVCLDIGNIDFSII